MNIIIWVNKCIFIGGAIDDFSKSVAKIPYVATVELSGTNGDGYVREDIYSIFFFIY